MRLLPFLRFMVTAAVLGAGSVNAFSADNVMSLAGNWQFVRGGPALQPNPTTVPAVVYMESITLPATTETAHKGAPSDWHSTDGLSHPWAYTGPCWYRRQLVIPDSWRGKHVTLFLERTKYSQCWLDGKSLGESAIVCTPQIYELGSDLAPGTHQLTLAVDNGRMHPYGADAHQYSGSTQGNWNGILGQIELRATSATWIDDVQIYPAAAEHRATVKVTIRSQSPDAAGEGTLDCAVTGPGVAPSATATQTIHLEHGHAEIELPLSLGPDAALWDEFHPNLDQLTVHLHGVDVDDQQQVTFGLRTFATAGQQFTINGQPTFLRGKHDACVFPLTGHPPMDVAGWLDYLRTCRSYGLNHIRFHTWVPPEAAFTAGDQLGFYLQPELPFWGNFDAAAKDALQPEAMAMLRRLGNHPSFVMFSMGNEHWGNADVLASLVAALKAADPRHLYVRGTNAISWQNRPGPGDDYLISADAWSKADGQIRPVRGANAGSSSAKGHVQFGPPNTLTDYATAIAGNTWPDVTHEMGQYTVYPDFKEIAKYVGVTRAYNFEQFRQNLEQAGMSDQDEAFAQASGALAAIGYREEIESCLRTPNYGGFELLDLQDYPGQGTALVGMLDAFMDSKGIITPQQWCSFCSPTVLLARFPKYLWTSDETFTADVDLAQYAAAALPDTSLQWRLCDATGSTLKSGSIAARGLAPGNVRLVGHLSVPLDGVPTPSQLKLELSLAGATISTQYPLWIYPPTIDTQPPAGVNVARTFDAAARRTLAAGGRVLLVCDADQPLARTVGGGFATDFWGFNFFHNKPGTMGILCDPATPALAGFPTESHSDWQWFDLTLHGQPLILDSVLPPSSRPIVQVIDNYVRCHKLGMIFELRVGDGRLLVCTSDLLRDAPTHPESRQLLASLLHYAGSDAFAPRDAVSASALADLLQTTIPLTGVTATASSYDKGWQGYSPAQLIDGNDDRGWKADSSDAGASWCQLQFPKPVDFDTLELLWENPRAIHPCTLQQSADGKTWHTLMHGEFFTTGRRQDVPLHARGITHLRVTINATGDDPAAIDEIRLFPPRSTEDRR
jgi:hypothetical protein